MTINRAFLRNLTLCRIIGGLGAGLDFPVFTFPVRRIGINEFAANIDSSHCGVPLRFYLTGLFVLALSSGIPWMGESHVIDTLLIESGSIVIVAILQFLINPAVAFQDR